ncbi:poly-beta-1,6-N-acetyl-D-glucosamine biosynthesis protein PgaD [Xenorhabdus innexi]|uniref:HmsS, Haemin storage system protein S n=1 Tax=Xenorhabdus innexi TaxID=290109 RepID=A0A1N6MW04_9GAMM|nr:poly-beta-1,6-N-acetyl-D-glucosamine biosynthesis protein PgaD [Xenorhabdus innexi]PHM37548.1 poly-beta-1,6-N-acetyl-D-glucosamine biosynthesis protein PgaD [Xenorhabdus innexi]SIP72967.1 HmsS, Haemin storage system protein S [Xenorhabdus innexi]
MKEPLIFTEQKLLPRLIDITLTVLAWVGFVYLFIAGLFNSPHHGPKPVISIFSPELSSITLYIIVALFNAFLLIGWAKYNQIRFRIERRRHRPALNHNEIATSFSLGEKLINNLNQGKVSSITHDNHGHIVGVAEKPN